MGSGEHPGRLVGFAVQWQDRIIERVVQRRHCIRSAPCWAAGGGVSPAHIRSALEEAVHLSRMAEVNPVDLETKHTFVTTTIGVAFVMENIVARKAGISECGRSFLLLTWAGLWQQLRLDLSPFYLGR